MRVPFILLALLLSGCTAIAEAGRRVEVQVVSAATGRILDPQRHRGQSYVAGEAGERYAVVLQNRSDERLLAVLSVDGVNAITGETAGYRQSGYVLEPWGRVEVRGWRKSGEEVAAFYFTSLADAYAARTGRPDHVGVIGAAVFQERPEAMEDGVAAPRASAPMAAQARKEAERDRLGTGHGERLASPARYTEFRRAAETPVEQVVIRYDSRERLVARGILPPPQPRGHEPRPNPFPGGFVPDPPPR